MEQCKHNVMECCTTIQQRASPIIHDCLQFHCFSLCLILQEFHCPVAMCLYNWIVWTQDSLIVGIIWLFICGYVVNCQLLCIEMVDVYIVKPIINVSIWCDERYLVDTIGFISVATVQFNFHLNINFVVYIYECLQYLYTWCVQILVYMWYKK